MEKGINLQIHELKENMTQVINDAKLPIAVVQMALFELTAQVNNISAQTIENERKAYQEGENQNGKEIHTD
ncbi:MAG TPA: hypothetical protein GXX75_09085 [Clostridiales bacterium]|nr:hypothetical protein [Clostridiales bacterium]